MNQAICQIAEEAIKFQISSSFTDELDKFNQSVIDLGNNIKSTNNTTDVFKQIEKEFKFKYVPQLRSIIKKYTNIDLKEIAISRMFAIHISGRDINRFATGIFAAEGRTKLKKKKDLIDKLKYFSSLVNKNEATIQYKKLSKVLNCSLYYDLEYVTMSKEFSLTYTSKLAPTAQEITATLLHEIGHIFTMLEYAGHLMYLGYVGNNILYQTSQLSKQILSGKRKLTDNEAKELNSEINSMMTAIDESSIPEIQSKIKILQNLASNFLTTRTSISDLIVVLILLVIFPFSFPYYAAVISFYCYLIPDNFVALLFRGRSKETMTQAQNYIFERLADEFVSRYGYSRYLNNGLSKYSKFLVNSSTVSFTKIDFTSPTSIAYNHLVLSMHCLILVSRIFTIPNIVSSFFLSNFGYEAIQQRLYRNLQNMLVAFKDWKNMDSNYRIRMINEVEGMKKDLFKWNSLYTKGKMIKFIADYLYGGKVTKALLSGVFSDANTKEEIRNALNAIDDLTANPLYFHAAKIYEKINM